MIEPRPPDGLWRLIAAQSDAIRVCRVLCIVPVAYVHVSLGEDQTLLGAALRGVFRDLLGRSSVLLLSVVSGLLMVRVFATRSFGAAAWGRVKGLVVPMAVWNALALGLLLALGRPLPSDLANAVLAATDHGVTRPLTFLRDLFLVSLCTPLLVAGIRRGGLWLLVPLALAGGFVSTKPLVAHSQIVAYFAIGVGFGVLPLERLRIVRISARLAPWLLAALVVLTAARPLVSDPLRFMDANAFDALVRRPICAASFWVISAHLAKRERARDLVARWLEPAIFAMFLSHAIALEGLRAAALSVGLGRASLAPIVWLVLPLLALGLAILGQRVLLRLPGVFHQVLLGKPKPPAGRRRSSQPA